MRILKNLRFLAVPTLFSLLSLNASAQDTYPISDEVTITDVSCASSVIITDSDADDGNYLPNESYQITICVEDVSLSPGQIIISPELNGDVWDVDENSSLFIYDGEGTGGDLLGEFNSVSHPAGVNVSGQEGCLTLVFTSGESSTGEGFTANFACFQPLQPFNFEITSIPELGTFEPLPLETINICFGDSIIVGLDTSYPLSDAGGNGYEQSDETSYFRYLMGDGTTYEGFGLTDITHTYETAFGYQVTVIVQDVSGRIETEQFFVLIAPRPDFSNIAINDTLCIGEQTTITGGIFETDTVGVDPTTSAILGGGILGEQLYLPDGNDENYETTITIDEFDDDQVIENVSDIINFCVNIEHSYLGDLEMMLTCPDGTSINIFNSYTGDGLFPDGFGGGGTFLGDAFDQNIGNPGIGFDYCFAMDAEFGTMADEFDAGNTVEVSTFSAGDAMAPGTYLPEESFEEFIGCPINGDWTLTIRDNLGVDDGFVFNWSIYFDPNINPSTVYYSPDIIDAYWEENEDIVVNEGTSIVVEPSQEGNNSFTFFAEDEFGCLHDTTIQIYVRPFPTLVDATACDLTHTLAPTNTPGGGEWEVLSAPNENATVTYDFISGAAAEVTVSDYGLYNFQITESNCGYQTDAVIDFRPDPQLDSLPQDLVLCVGESIVLDVGDQLPNSDNFSIVWTQNGNAFNNSDYAVTVDETGTYAVNINGVCGEVSDQTDIVAITIEFEGDIVCGLQSAANAELSPEGNGTWSSDDPDAISFSAANQLSTAISAQQYGTYDITFTDSRCPEDGVTEEFTFVQQPEVTILPQNPDFCVELDSLNLTTNVSGSSNGVFLWSVNGQNQTSQADSLSFGPESFDPLEDYLIEVQVFDAFQVCPVATGSMVFTGVYCTYNIPNVVTPNGDNRNDRFHVEFMEFFPDTRLRIYDRWGKLVFEQENYDQYQASTGTLDNPGGWDPADENDGTYFYELSIPSADVIETGYIQVLRGND